MELKCPFPSSAIFTSLDDTIFLIALILDMVFLLLYTTYKSYLSYRRQTWIIMDVLCKCMSDKVGRSGSLWLVKLMQPRDFFLYDYHFPYGECCPTYSFSSLSDPRPEPCQHHQKRVTPVQDPTW